MSTSNPEILYQRYDSADLGPLLFMADSTGSLVACTFLDKSASKRGRRLDALAADLHLPGRLAHRLGTRPLREASAFEEHIAQLEEYLAGERREFTAPLGLTLTTPFQRLVLEYIDRDVPYGSTATYSQVAEGLRRPSASRAVGMALGANPLCVFLPCHRILGASGSLTGYAGGVDVKEHLLRLEGSLPVDSPTSALPLVACAR